jgi:very-short-patch-repair endonuclease
MMPDKYSNHNYNKNLQPYANRLRKEMIPIAIGTEACLWKYVLKAKRLRGYQFRRQRPILKYIVDFICLELMLVIEVDGLTHHWEETILKDKMKQTDLEAAGFTVLRFTDDNVLNDINSVHAFLEDWIERKINGTLKSTPT